MQGMPYFFFRHPDGEEITTLMEGRIFLVRIHTNTGK